MRFVVDECCHRLFASGLRREAGHDVLNVANDHSGAADYDFGEPAIRRRRPMPGVVLLAPSPRPISDRVARLVLVVSNLGDRLEGALTIIEDDRLRFRSLK